MHLTMRTFIASISIVCVILLCITPIVHGVRKVPVTLLEKRGPVSTQLMEAAEVAYSVERPDLDLSGAVTSSVDMIQKLFSNPPEIDFMVSAQKPGDVYHVEIDKLIQEQSSSIASFPVAASAIVPVYNLPGQAVPLLLSRSLLAQIMRGQITYWRDPLLLALNPAIVLPDKNITIVLPTDATTQTLAFTQALAKFDPTWVTDIGIPTDLPTWPVNKYYAVVKVSGSLGSYVASNPYTFSFSVISNAIPLSVQRASMINKASQVVVAGTASINYAFLELGSYPDPTQQGKMTWRQDLSDGSGYESWPMTFSIAVYMPLNVARTTCLARAEVVNFWLWFLASNVVQSIAQGLSISILPPLVFTNLDLNTYLRTQIKCEGSSVAAVALNQINMVGVSLATIYTDLSSSYLGFYGSTDSEFNFKYQPLPELQSIQQLSGKEVDAAMILPQQFEQINKGVLEARLYDPILAEADMETGDLLVLPYSLYGVAVIHTLPDSVAALWTAYPLKVSMEVLGQIFSAQITKWTDPALETLNPGLQQAFQTTGAEVNITLVTCCRAGAVNTAASPVSNAFVLALNASSLTFHKKSTWTLPITWSSISQTAKEQGTPFVDVTIEQQMESAVLRTQGAIGYKLSYSGTPDPLKEFAIVRETRKGITYASELGSNPSTPDRTELVTPTIAALQACANSLPAALDFTWNPSLVTPTLTNLDEVSKCYPITILSSLVVPGSYTGSECSKGNHTLSLSAWLLTEQALDTSANLRGMLRLNSIKGMTDLHLRALNSVECDGETLQIIRPVIWKLNGKITSFALALAVIGLIAVALSAIILGLYRHRSVIRSSSVPFQFVILFGIGVMFVSMGVFGSAPSTANCQSLAWLLNIGYTLMFGPLFAKMWRIYRIFDTRRLKVVKISNEKLALIPAVMVLQDVILNTVWQAYSPVYAAPLLHVENGRTTSYMQCTGDSGSLPFLIIIMAVKFLVLVFGSFMGFTTRNVASTFNESKNVAWAIYSVFFAVAIIVPILFFSNALGDSFTILVVFLLFWIAATTLLLNFGSKFLVLFKSEDGLGQMGASDHHSNSTGDMGMGGTSQLFSFPSLAVLPKNILDRYIAALEAQMRTAKQRHKLLLNGGGGTGTGLTQKDQQSPEPNQSPVQGTGGTGSLLHNRKQNSRTGLSDLGASPPNQTGGAGLTWPINSGTPADSYRVMDGPEDISVRAASPSGSPMPPRDSPSPDLKNFSGSRPNLQLSSSNATAQRPKPIQTPLNLGLTQGTGSGASTVVNSSRNSLSSQPGGMKGLSHQLSHSAAGSEPNSPAAGSRAMPITGPSSSIPSGAAPSKFSSRASQGILEREFGGSGADRVLASHVSLPGTSEEVNGDREELSSDEAKSPSSGNNPDATASGDAPVVKVHLDTSSRSSLENQAATEAISPPSLPAPSAGVTDVPWGDPIDADQRLLSQKTTDDAQQGSGQASAATGSKRHSDEKPTETN